MRPSAASAARAGVRARHGHGGARFEQRQRLAFGNGAAAHDQRGAVVQIGEQGKSFME